MSFQSTVSIKQGFSVPGEVFQDVPWTVLSYTLDSDVNPNLIGSTAYTITSEGFAEAGAGGTLGFAGFLCIPKDYALQGLDGSLAPTLRVPNFAQAELMTRGMLAVKLPAAADIGDFIIYDNDTGAISSIPPTNTIPDGFTFANATVSQFTQSVSGEGLAVINIEAGSATSSNISAFTYVNAYWAASNGNDANDGLSIDRPIQTIGNFITKITALTDPTAFVVLNVVDPTAFAAGAGGYTFPTNSNVFINAPGSILSTTGTVGLIRGTGGSLKITCASLSAPGQRLFTYGGGGFLFVEALSMTGNVNNDSGTGATMYINANASIIGNVAAGVDRKTVIKCDTITGTVTETSASAASYKMGLFATTITGNISSAQGSIYGQVYECGGTVSGVIQGIFDGVLINIA